MTQTRINHDAMGLDAVDREIAGRFRRLVFAPAIETVFLQDGLTARVRMLTFTGLLGIVMYNLFLIHDWLMLNDMFPEMVVARIGIFTPTILGCLVIGRRFRSPVLVESLAVFGVVLGAFLPMYALIFSESSYRIDYQCSTLLLMLFMSVVQRLRFRYCLAGLALILIVQVGALHLSGAFGGNVCVSIAVFFSVACAMLATTSYYLEHADRRSFLLGLRATILNGQIAALARTDALTGLANRRHLDMVCARIEAASDPRSVAAILLDIDHFKAFNDSQGHVEGDACLRAISAGVAAAVSGLGGHAFRYGGEELMILLDDSDLGNACRVAEAIRAAIHAAAIPHPALGEGAVVTASFGIAAGPMPEARIVDLIAAADTALYAAKRAGRNQVWPALPKSSARLETRQAA